MVPLTRWASVAAAETPSFSWSTSSRSAGRLAIRLTGQKAPTSELIALALSHANSLARFR